MPGWGKQSEAVLKRFWTVGFFEDEGLISAFEMLEVPAPGVGEGPDTRHPRDRGTYIKKRHVVLPDDPLPGLIWITDDERNVEIGVVEIMNMTKVKISELGVIFAQSLPVIAHQHNGSLVEDAARWVSRVIKRKFSGCDWVRQAKEPARTARPLRSSARWLALGDMNGRVIGDRECALCAGEAFLLKAVAISRMF